MGLGLHLSPELEQRIRLKPEQRAELKQLLSLRLIARKEAPPDALRGIEGLNNANESLKSEKAAGVLIGGVAEAIWNPRTKSKDLDAHKDVDIMVLREGTSLIESNQQIDWWLPSTERYAINYLAGTSEMNITKWENCNGVVLSHGLDLERAQSLEPGLYIPGYDFLRDRREYEARARVQSRDSTQPIDENVWDKFREDWQKRIKEDAMKKVQELIPGEILDYRFTDYHRTRALSLIEFDKEIYREITK